MKLKNKFFSIISLVILILGLYIPSVLAVRCEVTKDKIRIWNASTDTPGALCAFELYDTKKYNQAQSFPEMLDAVVVHEQFKIGENGWWSKSCNLPEMKQGIYTLKVSMEDKTENINVFYSGKDSITYLQNVEHTEEDTITFKTEDNSYYYHKFDKVCDGIYHINMDVNVGKGTSTFYMRLAGASDSNAWSDYNSFNGTFRFDSNGVFGVNSEIAEWNLSPQEFTYEYDKDYHLDIWLDMDRRTISYYIDGNHFSTQKLWESFTEWHGMIFSASGVNSLVNLKNFGITEYKYAENQTFPGLVVPEYIYDNIDAWFDTKNPGHVFFDSDICFDATVLNRENTTEIYELTVFMTDDSGDVLYIGEKEEIEIKPFEKKEIKCKIDIKKAQKQYGNFILKAEFKNKLTGESVIRDVRFSAARNPESLNSKIGIHTQFGHGYGYVDSTMSLLENAGFGIIRDYVDWATFNEANSWTLPQRYTAWEDIARENGQKQIMVLLSNKTMLSGAEFPNSDALRQDFAEYAYQLVLKLKGKVEVFEIWNEPSYKMTAEEYAELIIAVAPKIREANSNAKIATMVVADLFSSTQNWVIDVLEYIENKGLRVEDYMDIISVHPYRNRNLAPEQGPGVAQLNPYVYDTTPSLPGGISSLKEKLSEIGYGHIPLIATEMGWFTAPKPTGRYDNGTFTFDDTITELEQAQYSVRAAALLYEDLEYMTFHTLHDKMRMVDFEEFIGFTKTWKGIEIPYEAKPAFIAMANFNALLGNATCVEENVSGKVYNYKFKKTDGKTMNMMWTTDGENSVSYTSMGDGVWVYDILGNREYIAGKSLKINVSESPVYVEDAGLEIFDESGNALNAVTDGKALVKGIAGDVNCDYMLTVASYKGGRLLDVSITKSKGGNMSTDYIKTTDADEVRAFLWTESGVPVSDIIKITR